MSYFSQQMPTWENIGTEPPPDKRTRGWIVKDKPPAEWFNWLQNRTYACINEIRTVIDSLGTDELYNTLSSHMRDRINHTIYAVATGAVNTYIVSTSPAPTSYTDGMSISVKIPIANTGASTINWNGLGARPIVRFNGAAVSSGNLPANTIVSMRYSTTNSSFFLLGGSATGNATVSQVLSGRTFTNDEGEQIGTMANRGAITYTPTTTDFPIVEGYHSGSGSRTPCGCVD